MPAFFSSKFLWEHSFCGNIKIFFHTICTLIEATIVHAPGLIPRPNDVCSSTSRFSWLEEFANQLAFGMHCYGFVPIIGAGTKLGFM